MIAKDKWLPSNNDTQGHTCVASQAHLMLHDIMATLTLVHDSMLCIVTFFLKMRPFLCWARSSNELMQSTANVEARLEQLTADSMVATKGLDGADHTNNSSGCNRKRSCVIESGVMVLPWQRTTTAATMEIGRILISLAF